MNNFWDGFEKKAEEDKKHNKKYLLAGLGVAAALGAGLVGHKVHAKYFKTFKDATPKMDMWYTQGKFHSGPKRDTSHWYDAVKKTKTSPFTGTRGESPLHPDAREALDITWASRSKKDPHLKPFRHKGKWVTLEYGHYPHDPLLSDEINRRSPFARATVWDKKPHPDIIKQTREEGYKRHTDLIKEEGQAMKEFSQHSTGAGT